MSEKEQITYIMNVKGYDEEEAERLVAELQSLCNCIAQEVLNDKTTSDEQM